MWILDVDFGCGFWMWLDNDSSVGHYVEITFDRVKDF
jgi:hypothetical protein